MARRLPKPVAATLLLSGALLLVFVGAELSLRLLFPASRFMDSHRDDYWAARCREGLERYHPGQVDFGNVRLDPRLGWRMRPGFRREGESINSRGLRGPSEHPTVPADGCRLMILGDSFTYGLGVRDEETFAAILDEALPDCEVINAGVNGWGTDQQYLFWLIEGRGYRPNVVVLAFYVPDFHRNAMTIREFPKPWFDLDDERLVASRPPVPPSAEYCQSERFQGGSALRLVEVVGAVVRRFRGGEEAAHFAHKAELTTSILRDLKTSVDNAGGKLRVVVIPHVRGRGYADHVEIEAVIGAACEHYGIPYLNLTEPLEVARVEAGVDSFYGRHGHWNTDGHQHAAELIAEFLKAVE